MSLRRILKSQYSEQYNLTIERQITNDMLFRISYVGTQAHHLLASHDINYGHAETCLELNNIAAGGRVRSVQFGLELFLAGGNSDSAVHGGTGNSADGVQRTDAAVQTQAQAEIACRPGPWWDRRA